MKSDENIWNRIAYNAEMRILLSELRIADASCFRLSESIMSPHSSVRRTLQVAVLVDPGDSWGRGIIQGISGAVRNHLDWELLIDPRDDDWRYRVPRNWKGDGIIAAIRDEQTAKHISEQNVPAVSVALLEKAKCQRYLAITDDTVRAEMAFSHFHGRGFEHFAYFGPPSQRYTRVRGELFARVVSEAGFQCHVFQAKVRRDNPYSIQQQTVKWLKQLPRPLAIFAADPYPALQLSSICKTEGFHVPEEVAILSGDTDDLMCDVSDPPLSSILLASEQIGAASVDMLNLLMNGKTPAKEKVEIPPLGIRERRSTDVVALDDPHFSAALRYIRKNAFRNLQVGDVLKHVPVSRRWLEQRFRETLNRSPADEIRRIKLERVKHQLMATDLSLEEIARETGYSSASRMSYVFRSTTGITPITFRRSNRR